MDLKALLVEAKQKVPPVLQVLQTGDETMLDIGGESFTPNIVVIFFFFRVHVLLTNGLFYKNFKIFLSSDQIISSQICTSTYGVFANPF